jgi:hypothetical protein
MVIMHLDGESSIILAGSPFRAVTPTVPKKSPHSPNDESVLACRRGTMFVKKNGK